MSWTSRLKNVFRPTQLDGEVDEELRFHLAARVKDNLAAGMTPAEARQDAIRRLGGQLLAKDKTRDADILVWLETLGQDIRYAFRNLRNNAGVTAAAALSLALGIGANTAIFSALHAIVLRPLAFKDPASLAQLWLDNRRLGLHEDLTSIPNFEDWKKNRSFVDLAGFTPSDNTMTALEEPARLIDALVTPNLFSVLGVPPAMGRVFNSDEDQPARGNVIILSQGLWRRQFASDPQVLGKLVELDGKPYQIIGVMPAGFAFPSKETQLWRPLALSPEDRANRGGFFLSVVGRLKPGVSIEQGRAEMAGIGAQLESQYPDIDKGYGVWVVPLLDQVVGNMRQVLYVLLGAVAFVLLIACVNVANLLLGRGVVRGREIAVRAALGAGRTRIVRQLLTESTVLSMIAGAIGLLIAFWGIRGLVLLAPKDLPRLDEVSIGTPVLIFTLVVSLIAGILFGMAPALRISRVDLNETLREGGRSQSGGKRVRYVRSGLTIAEVALSMILLTGAGLMLRSLLSLQSIHPGFQTENILTWRIAPSRSKYPAAPAVAGFYSDMLQRLQNIPGVQGAAAVTDVFLSTTPNSGNFTVEGHPSPPPEQQIEATIDSVSPNYFQVMGVPLVRGSFFDGHETRENPPVMLINETMAKRFWPGEDVVGKRFKFGGAASTSPWRTVIGVVGDMRRQGMERVARCETFSPLGQRPGRGMIVVIHTVSDPEKVAGMVRDTVRAMDKSAVLFERSTIADQIGDSLSQRRFETILLGLFSLLALLLATVGIYGVVFQSVSQRVNEIGIRVALGASKGSLLRMIVGEAMLLVSLGAIAGGFAAFALSRTLSSFLYSVTAADPLTYVAVAVLLALAAGLASVIPARRATSIDPLNALRYE